MYDPGTILLTSQGPELLSAVADALPEMRALRLGAQPPSGNITGRIWCFVDWVLPEISGLELCRRLREAPVTAESHITLVLEDDDGELRRRALRAGADDYCIGPLTAELLISRLKDYRAGTASGKSGSKLTHGGLQLDLAAQSARWRGKNVILRPNEFRLLTHFVDHPNQVFSRTSLIAKLGKDTEAIDERTVDVWIGRLRRTLKAYGVPDPLRTVRSMGYVLDGVPEVHETV